MRPFWLSLCAASLCFVPLFATADELRPVRIAKPIGGHIHPAACVSPKGTIVVTYGQINHRDLRILRSTDGGRTWTEPMPFEHTIKKTYYPGSLTTLRDGRMMHAWNRWSGETNELEPRSVLFSLSADDGLTWSEPKPLPRTENVMSVIRHPIVELETNRWLVPLSDRTFLFDPVTDKSEPFGDGRLHALGSQLKMIYRQFGLVSYRPRKGLGETCRSQGRDDEFRTDSGCD